MLLTVADLTIQPGYLIELRWADAYVFLNVNLKLTAFIAFPLMFYNGSQQMQNYIKAITLFHNSLKLTLNQKMNEIETKEWSNRYELS